MVRIIKESNDNLLDYLSTIRKSELKYMHSHDIDDSDFGVETDKYRVCNAVLSGTMAPESMLNYMKKYYGDEYEKDFINNVERLMSNESVSMNESDIDFLFNKRSKQNVKTHIYNRLEKTYSQITSLARKYNVKVEPMFPGSFSDFWVTSKKDNTTNLFKFMREMNPAIRSYDLEGIYNELSKNESVGSPRSRTCRYSGL